MGLIIMSNILVTGANGQLGSEIRYLSNQYSYNFVFTDKDSLDITKRDDVEKFVYEKDINIIINCAAYTAVDRAEEERELAELINYQAVKDLAQIAKKNSIQFIHISTDYVFDGTNYKPYTEDEQTKPQGVYGVTKLKGEEAFLNSGADGIIIRTSWVYSSFGTNFVKTMLRLGKERDSIRVIFDQIGTPTYARDLAKAILDILPNITNNKVEIYHYSNEGVLSWYDFAREIMKMSKIECQINPIETKEYPTLAKRPYYSLLNKSRIKEEFGLTIPYWKDSLDECLKKMRERK